MALFFGTAVSFQVLTITKTRSEVIGDVKELQFLCLDGHNSVVALHGVLDEVPLGQVGKARSPFQYIEKRKYLCRRLPAVPESMGRQRHEDQSVRPSTIYPR
jgi:hypothetical protein